MSPPLEPGARTDIPDERHCARILVADDNEATLEAIARFLEDERYQVIRLVRDGVALVSDTVQLHPDVAVVDILMPEMNGLDATAHLRRMNCNTRIVVLTAHREPEFVRAAFASGALGYVLKHRLVSDLPNAIEMALRGERFLSPPLEGPGFRPQGSFQIP
jgi:DNA-binding NarL/FixJ family response regulator